MSRFTIVPFDKAKPPTEFIGNDPGSALALVERLNYGDADILENGTYLCTATLSEGGFWLISARKESLESVET
ncbi:hypothetical protein WBP07_01335 [Novosphingobium sp. BL-8A]|uniref:hypothetical protein n=1 Tax=Novosphingobium sp. BL-8A TaxID=3127639 RepID=UPI0037563D49